MKKVAHIVLDRLACAKASSIVGSLSAGDVVVVACNREIDGIFEQIVEKQLRRKEDSAAELSQLTALLKGYAANAEAETEVDKVSSRIYSLLNEGMTLNFSDNSLVDYLRAFVVGAAGRCFASHAGDVNYVDGRDIMVCESVNGMPSIDWKCTEERIHAMPKDSVNVVAGAYGRQLQGTVVDLGRGGSELTANVIAATVGADKVVYYTSGFNYDGRKCLTYEEAYQSFVAGSPVFRPAMLPARKANLPLELLDLADDKLIVEVTPQAPDSGYRGITGVACSDPMTLVTVYGTGLLGSIGISSAIFGALAAQNVNIHFISQSMSEYSISFAVRRYNAVRAENALRALIEDTKLPTFNDLTFDVRDVAIVNVFGYNMRNVPGISGKVYSALGNAGISVIAASQGGEEMSISIVVSEQDAQTASSVLTALKQ